MRNDLIVLNISSDRPGEAILVEPIFIDICAKSLIESINVISSMEYPDLKFNLYFAEAQKGSLKIGFFPLLWKEFTGMSLKDKIEASEKLAKSMAYIFSIFLATGVSLGYFSPVNPDERIEHDINDNYNNLIGENSIYNINIQNMMMVVSDNAKMKVEISIPNFPTCRFNSEKISRWSLVGSQAKHPYLGDGENIEGDLTLHAQSVDIIGSSVNKAYIGDLSFKGGRYIVAVFWASKRPVPAAGIKVRVKGSISGFNMSGSIQPQGLLVPDFRNVEGIFTVASQIIEE